MLSGLEVLHPNGNIQYERSLQCAWLFWEKRRNATRPVPSGRHDFKSSFSCIREKSNLSSRWQKHIIIDIFFTILLLHQYFLYYVSLICLWYRDVSQTQRILLAYIFLVYLQLLLILPHSQSPRHIAWSLSQSLNQLVTWSTNCSNSIYVDFCCLPVAMEWSMDLIWSPRCWAFTSKTSALLVSVSTTWFLLLISSFQLTNAQTAHKHSKASWMDVTRRKFC